MPPGINLPKAAIALAAAGSTLVGAAFGLLAILFSTSGSPDFQASGITAEFLSFILFPLALAAACGWLLRRHADAIGRAGRDPRTSLTALVWLGNFGLSLAFALYLAAEAGYDVRWGGLVVSSGFVWVLAVAAFLLTFGCAWAIARSLRGLVALAVLAALAVAVKGTGALSAWLNI